MFQFTHPVWGATLKHYHHNEPRDVSIHAPRVGRDIRGRELIGILNVSIHAPRVGRDAGVDTLRLI